MRKFYCQNCGKEVPLNLDYCPSCNSQFESVLCPKCGYSGKSSQFYNGCPKCGYLKNSTPKKKSLNLTFKLFISTFTLLVLSIIVMLVLI